MRRTTQGFSLSMVIGTHQGFSLIMVLGAHQCFSLSMGFRLSMILGALQGFSLSMVLVDLQGFSLSMDYSFSCRADPSRLPPLNLPPVPDLRHTPLPPLWRVPSPLPWLQPVARTMAPRLTSRLQPRRWGGSVLRIQRFSWTPLDPNAPRPRLHYYSGHDPLKNKEEPRSVTMDDTGLEIKGEDQAAQNQRENQNQGVGLLPLDQTRPGIRGHQGPEEPLVGPLMFAISEPSGTVPQNREMATPVLMHCFEGRKGPGRQSSLAALHTRQLDPRSDLHNLHDLQESGGTSRGVVRGTLPQVLREFQARQSMGSLLLGPDGEVLQLSLYENHADRLQLVHRDEVTEEEKVIPKCLSTRFHTAKFLVMLIAIIIIIIIIVWLWNVPPLAESIEAPAVPQQDPRTSTRPCYPGRDQGRDQAVADLACPLVSMATEDSSTEMAQRTRNGRKKDLRKMRRGDEELGRAEDFSKDEGRLCPPPANSGQAAKTAANRHTYVTSGTCLGVRQEVELTGTRRREAGGGRACQSNHKGVIDQSGTRRKRGATAKRIQKLTTLRSPWLR
ncbi:unnamed protein product [Boreogadus saida]